MMSRNVSQDVQWAVPHQHVADDAKRGLHDEGAVVNIKLLKGGVRHFERMKLVR